MKIQYYGPEAPLTLPVICERETVQLHVVTRYKHLGGICHHAGDQRTELKQRFAIAHNTLSQHRKLIFHNQRLPLATRTELFQMLVLTKFLYGADSWIAMDQTTQDRFHSGVIKLYRPLFRLPADQHCTDDDVLVQIELPSLSVLLRRRLRYLLTLVQADLPDAWTMLAKDSYWCGLLEEDLCWMWDQLKHSSVLKDPRLHYPQWLFLMQTSPRYWKRLVRRACAHSVLQRQKRHQVRALHCQALDIMRRILPSDPFAWEDAPASPAPTVYGCMKCQLRCKSKAGEDAHAFKKHQRTSYLRHLCDHPTCPSCLKFFHAM